MPWQVHVTELGSPDAQAHLDEGWIPFGIAVSSVPVMQPPPSGIVGGQQQMVVHTKVFVAMTKWEESDESSTQNYPVYGSSGNSKSNYNALGELDPESN